LNELPPQFQHLCMPKNLGDPWNQEISGNRSTGS